MVKFMPGRISMLVSIHDSCCPPSRPASTTTLFSRPLANRRKARTFGQLEIGFAEVGGARSSSVRRFHLADDRKIGGDDGVVLWQV